MILICIFLVTKNAGHVFTCFLAIWYILFFKDLFLVFACGGPLLPLAGFLLWRMGATFCCRAQASHHGGFSCCRARAVKCMGFSNCGTLAQLLRGMQDLPRSRDQTSVPCTVRWILNHWTTREVPVFRLGKMSICPMFNWLFVLLILSCMSYLHILGINPLLFISFANIFLHLVGCLLILWLVSFAVQKL